MSASHAVHRCHHERAVEDGYLHGVADVDLDLREQFLAQAETLAVAPLLDPGDLLGLSEV
jgi:hypothetical protein